jgi:hypothetical protein
LIAHGRVIAATRVVKERFNAIRSIVGASRGTKKCLIAGGRIKATGIVALESLAAIGRVEVAGAVVFKRGVASGRIVAADSVGEERANPGSCVGGAARFRSV